MEGVYKVERKGEEERFQACGIGNHRYLWHGTSITNMVSILNRGLVSTPLDAQAAGNAFGKVSIVFKLSSVLTFESNSISLVIL